MNPARRSSRASGGSPRIAPATVVFALAIGSLGAGPARALPAYLTAFETQYPAAAGSRIDSCSLCHSNVPQLNSYGSAFASAGMMFAPIEASDSDGDGAINLAEILALTFPGDANDVPALPSATPTATPVPPSATATATTTPTSTPVVTGTAPQTATATATAEVTPTNTGGRPCVGDCDGNGRVTVSELVRAVNISLGTAEPSTCLAADPNGNGVTIDELVRAVGAALNGC